MSDNSSETVANNFISWCADELKFNPQSGLSPSAEEIKELCRGQGVKILEHLMTQVRAKDYVQKVKLNIQLDDALDCVTARQKDDEKETKKSEIKMLRDYYDTLRQDVAHRQKEVQSLTDDVKRIESDIHESENARDSAWQEVNDMRRKRALLNHFRHEQESTAQIYDELRQRLRDKVESINSRADKAGLKTYYTPTVSLNESCAAQLHETNAEHESYRRVRETCSTIESFLHQLLRGQFQSSQETMTSRKDTLQQLVAHVSDDFAPAQLVRSLCSCAQDDALEVRQKAASVDPKRDAELLRFEMETNGSFKDTSVAPCVVESVTSLVEAAHRENIERYMRTQASLNEIDELETRLEAATAPVHDHLARSFRGNTSALELARALLRTELDCITTQAQLTSLQSELQLLAASGEASRMRRKQLEDKFRQIQDFSLSVEQKQNLIQVLVKHNRSARSRLDTHQRRLGEYMQRSVSVHEPEVRSHVSDLESSTDAEVDAFKRIPLPFLVRVQSGEGSDDVSTTLPELSIRRCLPEGEGSMKSAKLLREVSEVLDCAPFLASECLPQQIWRLHQELAESALAQRSSDAMTLGSTPTSGRDVNMERSQVLSRHLASLCEQVRAVDAQQNSELVPLLKERIVLATQALNECAGVKEALRFWWEQPAQDLTPWRKVEGRTYQQWKDKFVVLLTRLRQEQLNRK